jgi:hypothetical protein
MARKGRRTGLDARGSAPAPWPLTTNANAVLACVRASVLYEAVAGPRVRTSAFAGAIAPYNLFSAHRPTPSRKQVCRLVFFFLFLIVIIPLSVPPWHGLAGFSRVRHGGVTMCAKMSFFLRLFVQLRDPHSVQHQLLLLSGRYRNPRRARVTIGQRGPDRGRDWRLCTGVLPDDCSGAGEDETSSLKWFLLLLCIAGVCFRPIVVVSHES